jgi:hypothetical protein
VPFLSAQTLHVVDRLLWMAPFAIATDLNEACRRADVRVSHEERNRFLTKMLDEHSAPGSCEQLRKLWSEWVKEQYPTTAEESANPGRMRGDAETPEGSDTEEAEGGS